MAKFKGITITPNQTNKIIKNFKKSQKLNLSLTQKPLDYGELLCETDSQIMN